MARRINKVKDLPEWFDIRNYEGWEQEDPYQATWAVNDKFSTEFFLFNYSEAAKEDENLYQIFELAKGAMLGKLVESSKHPFRRSYMKIPEIFTDMGNEYYHGGDIVEARKLEMMVDNEMDVAIKSEVRDLADKFNIQQLPSFPNDSKINRLSLYDVNVWLGENRELLNSIEEKAILLSEKNDWDLDEVKSSLYAEIPFIAEDGDDVIRINPHPTPVKVGESIKEYLEKIPYGQMESSSVKPSDVKKIFKYKVAAYVDLKCWAFLTGNTITKKCYAQAMFPNGEFGELDMQRTKTIGRFIIRLRKGYIEDLTRKASEMKTLQI